MFMNLKKGKICCGLETGFFNYMACCLYGLLRGLMDVDSSVHHVHTSHIWSLGNKVRTWTPPVLTATWTTHSHIPPVSMIFGLQRLVSPGHRSWLRGWTLWWFEEQGETSPLWMWLPLGFNLRTWVFWGGSNWKLMLGKKVIRSGTQWYLVRIVQDVQVVVQVR